MWKTPSFSKKNVRKSGTSWPQKYYGLMTLYASALFKNKLKMQQQIP